MQNHPSYYLSIVTFLVNGSKKHIFPTAIVTNDYNRVWENKQLIYFFLEGHENCCPLNKAYSLEQLYGANKFGLLNPALFEVKLYGRTYNR